MFAVQFVVALAMGQLTTRLRAQQVAERKLEERASALDLRLSQVFTPPAGFLLRLWPSRARRPA